MGQGPNFYDVPGGGGTTSPLSTKGDLYTYASADARQAVGTNGQGLIADSNQTNGIRYQDRFPKNYILNNDAEVGTEGWATYADSAANIPEDGTGGTATSLTFSRSTSSPLRGSGQFSMVQANSTSLQGKGVSYDFTIDSADQARILAISFDYNASSTFVASDGITPPLNDNTTTTNAGNSDIEVFIYDVTNAVLIPVNPEVITGKGSNNFGFFGTFQAASNSTSYRLIFHIATTSANATGWTFLFDRVYVGQQIYNQGPSIGDWVLDSNFGYSALGTVSSSTAWTKIVGDMLFARGTLTIGTTAASAASINFPSKYVIDSTKMDATTNDQNCGIAYQLYTASNAIFSLNGSVVPLFYDGSLTSAVFFATNAGATSKQFSKVNGSTWLSSGSKINWSLQVPIAGKQSTTLLSNNSDTRVVAALITGDPASATSGNPIIVPTVGYDSHGSYNASTGRYTCPVSGIYKIFGSLQSASSATTLTIFKNANSTSLAGNLDSNGEATFISAVNCVAGDIIDLRPGGTVDATNMTMTIERLSGPATIAASETVSMRYYSSSSSVSGSLGTITYATKDWDTHNGYSSGVYTVPISGKYQVNSGILISGTFALNSTVVLEIQKNSSVTSRNKIFAGGIITNGTAFVADQLNCVAGDTIRVQVSCSATGPAVVSDNFSNFLSITRIGN